MIFCLFTSKLSIKTKLPQNMSLGSNNDFLHCIITEQPRFIIYDYRV